MQNMFDVVRSAVASGPMFEESALLGQVKASIANTWMGERLGLSLSCPQPYYSLLLNIT